MKDYTTNEAALALGIQRRSVCKLINQGILKAEKRGRDWFISQEEIDRYSHERTGPGMTGKRHSAETKEKMRQARLKNNSAKGRPLSPETKAKIRARRRRQPRGHAAYAWKGGKYTNSKGYVVVYAPDHPYAVKVYVLEHRLIVEQRLGRLLAPNEIVHHINGITTDNRPENLEVMTRGEHNRHHHRNPHIKRRKFA